MRVFADTNVLFDVFAQREPFRDSAYRLMIMQAFGDIELWTAPQSYLNMFYVLSKTTAPNRLQKAFSLSLDRINLCSTSHVDMQEAMRLGWDDLEDALIAVSCAKISADYLLTRDAKQEGFKQLSMPAITPEEFLACIERDYGISYGEEGF